jgi:hypothetical protein
MGVRDELTGAALGLLAWQGFEAAPALDPAAGWPPTARHHP